MRKPLKLVMGNTSLMDAELHKFPSTPHLAWLGTGSVRGDKILSEKEVESFLSRSIVVEEKVDGANLGLSFDDEGALRFQNRGNWLQGKLDGQWSPLRGWVAKYEARLRNVLPPNHILFGEWCYARHSVLYKQLPDWFLMFDVYDSLAKRFWSVARRNALIKTAGLASVPELAKGVFAMSKLRAMLETTSAIGNEVVEGLYLRQESENLLVCRAKLVNPDFAQKIDEHWTTRTIVRNSLQPCKALVESLPGMVG